MAKAEVTVDALLARTQAPSGVVFDIALDNPATFAEVVAEVRQDIQRLRARFADLEVAVVTHGVEMFALMAREAEDNADLHASVRALTETEEVPVHVCGTHAHLKGQADEDFPAYVDVSASGPAQVNDYRALGYDVILVK